MQQIGVPVSGHLWAEFSQSHPIAAQTRGALTQQQHVNLPSLRLTDDDLKVFGQFPKMRRIFMRENKIQKLDSLKELSQLEDLIQVELKENPICDSENYRESVYSMYTISLF